MKVGLVPYDFDLPCVVDPSRLFVRFRRMTKQEAEREFAGIKIVEGEDMPEGFFVLKEGGVKR